VCGIVHWFNNFNDEALDSFPLQISRCELVDDLVSLGVKMSNVELAQLVRRLVTDERIVELCLASMEARFSLLAAITSLRRLTVLDLGGASLEGLCDPDFFKMHVSGVGVAVCLCVCVYVCVCWSTWRSRERSLVASLRGRHAAGCIAASKCVLLGLRTQDAV
jgi:hypothetical protein